jgi:zinc-ribbon domain
MAFCTNCGSQMDANSHFCTKCGKSVTAAATGAGAAAAPAQAAAPQTYAPQAQTYTPQAAPAQSGGSGVLKIILVVIGVFVLIGILGVSALMYTAYRVRRSIHVTQNGKNGSIDFGGFKASSNNTSARDLAHKIGVDIYPGATPAGDSTEAQFGNMSTANIKLTTNDSVQKVAEFYKSRYSKAMFTTSEDNKFSMVGDSDGGTLTITAEDEGGSTKIEIVKVSGMKIQVK